MKKIIWFDLTNTPHNIFLNPIVNNLRSKFDMLFSMRDFAETENLFKQIYSDPYIVIGNHKGKNKILKLLGSLERTIKLYNQIDYFDLKISVGGDASNYVSKMKFKKSITFDDNETAPNWRYSGFSDFSFWPKSIDSKILLRQGFKDYKLYQYDGYKEDIYVADYIPNNRFIESLPFKEYILVRPENINANYIQNGTIKSIVPDLLTELNKKGFNVLYLPRYDGDMKYAESFKNIYIPDKPINGLDACYFSSAVLTGAGTLAREAACLGIPSVSFYAGKNILSVDKNMAADGLIYLSRDIIDIMKYLKCSKRSEVSLEKSKFVKNQVINKLNQVIDSLI